MIFYSVILAQTSEIPSSWTALLDRYGLPLAFLGLVLWQGGKQFTRLVAERDAAQADLRALEASMRDKVIPALTLMTDAATRMIVIAERIERHMERGDRS